MIKLSKLYRKDTLNQTKKHGTKLQHESDMVSEISLTEKFIAKLSQKAYLYQAGGYCVMWEERGEVFLIVTAYQLVTLVKKLVSFLRIASFSIFSLHFVDRMKELALFLNIRFLPICKTLCACAREYIGLSKMFCGVYRMFL